MSRTRLALGALAGAVLAAAAVAPPAGAAATWRLEQPPPPAGAPFVTSFGAPTDLQFWAPNRGLLGVEGNAVTARGLLYYDGRAWSPLATVCGGSTDTMRIAWAGPREWWTISAPSRPRIGDGVSLCHFRDGEVVASYGQAPESADPYFPMNAASCNGPNDCWFGGVGAEDPTGQRVGAFRLHWDGASLTTVYGPQSRGITDLEAHGGTLFESVRVGTRAGNRDAPRLGEAETLPRLLHRRTGGRFVNEPFLPQPLVDVPDDGTEMLALDSDGAQLWAVGGGAESGPSAPSEGIVPRPPLAARMAPGGGFAEVIPNAPPDAFGPTDRFTDVAALPGTSAAHAAVSSYADRRSANARGRIARIEADGTTTVERVPAGGAGRGTIARVACVGPQECWAATYGGWLYHLTDGTLHPQDDDPIFRSLITFRPNEAAAQFIPDSLPIDDSALLAPPPVEIETAAPPQTTTRRVSALLRNVRARTRGRTLTVSFRLSRRAKVQLIAQRGRKVVARTKYRTLRPGQRRLTLRLNPKRWPTRLRFRTSEDRRQQEPETQTPTGTGDAPAVVL